MKFIDEVKIRLKAGDGGNGCISFFRGPHLPKGGPDGGDGGRGGSIYFQASHHLQSLLDFKYRPEFKAQRGQDGQGRNCHGRSGEDLLIEVPIGTQIKNPEGEILYDILDPKEKVLVAKGGRGGKGNDNFKSSTCQAPRIATPGSEGEELEFFLELKSLCDIGLVGFPNAGKSTLLGALTSAKPKVGAYPFTTLQPHLGVVESSLRLLVADIPGLVEGAHLNRGLGHRFLKHITRSKVILYLLCLDPELGLQRAYENLQKELFCYQADLVNRPYVLVVNKSDLLEADTQNLSVEEKQILKEDWESFSKTHPKAVLISAKQHSGLSKLVKLLEEELLPPEASVLSCS